MSAAQFNEELTDLLAVYGKTFKFKTVVSLISWIKICCKEKHSACSAAIKLSEDYNLKNEREAGGATDKPTSVTDDVAALKAMVAQQSKQLSNQNKQIQTLKGRRDGKPKQNPKEQDSNEIPGPMCT
eukprot:365281-Rhodomonas_salina.1